MALLRSSDIDANDMIARRSLTMGATTAVSQTSKVLGLHKAVAQTRILAARAYASAVAGTVGVSVFNIAENKVFATATFTIDATAEKYKSTTAARTLVYASGLVLEKAAATAQTFTAAHVVTASKYGIILIQQNLTTGAWATKVPASTQAYDDAASALAALPAATAGYVAAGYIEIHNNTGDWTANTDDLTNGSDLTTAAFTSLAATAVTTIVPAALTNVEGTILTTSGANRVLKDSYIVTAYTTDGTGALTNGRVEVDIRPDNMRGDTLLR